MTDSLRSATGDQRSGSGSDRVPVICCVGDVHGHGQLALCVAAAWQQALDVQFDVVLLAGDVAAYSRYERMDKATRRHAAANPFEMDLLKQFMTDPPAPWLAGIFAPVAEGGMGLTCPIVMVKGNHEDFEQLAAITPQRRPAQPVPVRDLPRVDPAGRISLLPTGWRTRTDTGLVVAGVGGLEREQRPGYVDGAYFDDDDIDRLLDAPPADVLLTHTGPAATQTPPAGSELMDLLLGRAKVWFHGHSTHNEEIASVEGTTVVPLHGVPFDPRRGRPNEPGRNAWSVARFCADGVQVTRLDPDRSKPDQLIWDAFRLHNWVSPRDRQGRAIPDMEDQRVAPPLIRWMTGAPRS